MNKLYKNSLLQDLQQAEKTHFHNPRIFKSPTLKNNLNLESSQHQMNKLVCMLTNKQNEQLTNTKKEIRKSFIQSVHKSLVRYSKKKSNIEEFMDLTNKESDQIDAQQLDLKPIMLERKYNIPLSIKYSVIKETESIIENKNKFNEKQQNIQFSAQPLVKQMNRIASDHKNKNKNNFSHSFESLANSNTENLGNYITRKQRNTQKYQQFKSYYKNQEKNNLAQSEGLKPGCLKGLSKINRKRKNLNSILNMSFNIQTVRQWPSVEKIVLRNQYIRMNL